MPTWEGDPRPVEDEPVRHHHIPSYHYTRDEPVLVRRVNSTDAIGAMFAVMWYFIVLAWFLLVLIIRAIVWIVRKVTRRGAPNLARRSSRHR